MKKQVLFMILMMISTISFADDAVKINGIYYNLISKAKTAEVTSNPNIYSGNITIPSSVNHNGIKYSVTAIANNAFNHSNVVSVTMTNSIKTLGSAFWECDQLKSVTLSDSIKSIPDYTFYNCSSLSSITIPSCVEYIGRNVFRGCTNLKDIHIKDIAVWCRVQLDDWGPFVSGGGKLIVDGKVINNLIIPDGVQSVNPSCFACCASLQSVVFPNSLFAISNGAFYDCLNLQKVVIPNSVTSIGESAFASCNISSIIIPNSVISIGRYAFASNSQLDSITIEKSNQVYDSRQECNAIIHTSSNSLVAGSNKTTIPNGIKTIGELAFEGLKKLSFINIPNSVQCIDNSAFYQCSNLKTVVIGSGVSSIGRVAFGECKEISDVFCYAQNPPTTGLQVFRDSYIEYATLHVPAEAINLYKSAAAWSDFGKIVALSDSDPQPTDIKTVPNDSPRSYYSIDGLQIEKPQRGINLVKMKDGTTKKVWVK